jgi:hypothetical protein
MPLLSIAMPDVPSSEAGLGSGIVNVSMQMSAALGLAVLGTVATNHTKSLEATGQSAAAALTGGYQLAFLIGGITTAVGTVVAIVLLKGTGPGGESEERLKEMDMENATEPIAT